MFIEITEVTKQTWITFVDEIEPLRKDLFRYSLKLTGNPFDTEDLVHDGMLKAFSSMASHQKPLISPKPYLLRIISNLWIDSVRRSQFSLIADDKTFDEIVEDDLREAVAKLVVSVNPREQAIIVLSEVFEMTHKEIANVLSTSQGAVKMALHRTRKKLSRSELPARAPKELVENFITLFQTHDINAFKALLSPEFKADVFPYSAEAEEDNSWLGVCLSTVEVLTGAEGAKPLRVVGLAGEFVILVSRDHGDGYQMEEIWRFEAEDGCLIKVKDYGFSPDLVGWVADELNLPYSKGGYRLQAEPENDYNAENKP